MIETHFDPLVVVAVEVDPSAVAAIKVDPPTMMKFDQSRVEFDLPRKKMEIRLKLF